MEEVIRPDAVAAKIEELRRKHQDKDREVDTSEGSPYHQELTEWFRDQSASLDFSRMALAASRSYERQNRAYRNLDKARKNQISLFEDEALISLSLDMPRTMMMGDATRRQWFRHILVTNTQFSRQVQAQALKTEFQNTMFESFKDDEEQARAVARRLDGADDIGQAAD